MTLYCSQGHFNTSDSRFCRLCGEVLLTTGTKANSATEQLLGWRYRVVSQLGQGGFGRTYLAEDTNRFDEPCVLKEFAPQVQGHEELQKAEELFAREAGILYQLQHSQIPRFREMFRAEWQGRERIFLVQDYVAGETYYEVLKTRLQQGQPFSEAEVGHLLLQLLPVLSYIHSLGVIHRDISPDNLIQRSPDGLPVLIDFGGVKQVAAKVISASRPVTTLTQPEKVTRLGKVGYAPAEQLELGEVYPHSDLYALAVTVLVLFTGKEPEVLFNRNGSLNRHQWRQEVSLRSSLITILARMMDPYPHKRYQSAQEVEQALRGAGYSLSQTLPGSNTNPAYAQPGTPIPAYAPDPATIAVAPKGLTQPVAVPPVARPRQQKGRGVLVATMLLVGMIGAGWWAGVKWIGPALKAQLPEIIKPSPTKPSPKPTTPALQEPAFSKAEQERKQKIDTRRQQSGIDNAFFVELVNQSFYARHPEMNGRKLSMDAADADLRKSWDEIALQYLDRLEQISPESRSRLGQYTEANLRDRQNAVSQFNLSGRALNDLADAAFFHLFPEQSRGENLLNQLMGQVWQAISADQFVAVQSGRALQKIEFPSGNFSDRISGTLQPGQGKAYIANLAANQTLRLQLQAAAESVYLSLYPPTGNSPALLEDSRKTTWTSKLTESGYYEIVVVPSSKNPVDYTINLAVAEEVSTP